MRKTSSKRLRFSPETVRPLQHGELGRAAGGYDPPSTKPEQHNDCPQVSTTGNQLQQPGP
jgi:hypothetical protein